MVFYHHVSNFPVPQSEDDPTFEEQLELFEENIGQRVSAEVKAEKKMRAQLIAMGMDPDAKPELSPELAAKLAEDALKSDQDYFFSGALDSGKEIRGKRIKPGDNDFE